jgi:hypothetical protein
MSEANTAEPKISCSSESKSESSDEPLFVLKYRRREVVKRLIYYILPFAVLGNGIFHWWPPQGLRELLLEVMGAIALFICGAFFTDILFFREVRLYKHKFVKIWQFIGTMQILAFRTWIEGFHRVFLCGSEKGLVRAVFV